MSHRYNDFCDSQPNSNFLGRSHKNSIESFLLGNNVDIDYAKSLEPEIRNMFLMSQLFTVDEIESTQSSKLIYGGSAECLEDDNIGMILVKPEMIPYIEDIEGFLESVGVEYCSLDRVTPTKQDWLDTYGYMLMDHPNIVNMYVVQCSLGFRPIIFEHLSIERYESIADERFMTISASDKDTAFDQLYCGKSRSGFDGTIRHDIVLPRLISLGFNDMSGYASDFDPFNYYRDSDLSKTYISYNGIHSPKNIEEKSKNIKTYVIDNILK